MKTCTLCKTSKDESEFDRDYSKKSGFRPSCKECNKAKRRKGYIKERQRSAARKKIYEITMTAVREAVTHKECAKCKETKERDQFYIDRTRKSGMNPYCISCVRQTGIESRDRHGDLNPKLARDHRKLSLINALGGKCSVCGLTPSIDWPVSCFDFHHEHEKTVSMAKILMLDSKESYQIATDESKKCVVLCSNCHRRHHTLTSRSKFNGLVISPFQNNIVASKPQ